MQYLISRGVLKRSKGNYGDGLIVTGTYGNARGKTRFTTDPLYNYLTRLKQTDKDKQNINDVKENQKYLFSSNSSNSERVS